MTEYVEEKARDLIAAAKALDKAKHDRYRLHEDEHEAQLRISSHWRELASGIIHQVERGRKSSQQLENLDWCPQAVIKRRQSLIYEQGRRDSAAQELKSIDARFDELDVSIAREGSEYDTAHQSVERALASDTIYQSSIREQDAILKDQIELDERYALWLAKRDRMEAVLKGDRVLAWAHDRERKHSRRRFSLGYDRLIILLSGYSQIRDALNFSDAMVLFLEKTISHQAKAMRAAKNKQWNQYRRCKEARALRRHRAALGHNERQRDRLRRERLAVEARLAHHDRVISSAKSGVDYGTQAIAETLRTQYEREGDHAVMALARLVEIEDEQGFVNVMRAIETEQAHIQQKADWSYRQINHLAQDVETKSRAFREQKQSAPRSVSRDNPSIQQATEISAGIGGLDFQGFKNEQQGIEPEERA